MIQDPGETIVRHLYVPYGHCSLGALCGWDEGRNPCSASFLREAIIFFLILYLLQAHLINILDKSPVLLRNLCAGHQKVQHPSNCLPCFLATFQGETSRSCLYLKSIVFLSSLLSFTLKSTSIWPFSLPLHCFCQN